MHCLRLNQEHIALELVPPRQHHRWLGPAMFGLSFATAPPVERIRHFVEWNWTYWLLSALWCVTANSTASIVVLPQFLTWRCSTDIHLDLIAHKTEEVWFLILQIDRYRSCLLNRSLDQRQTVIPRSPRKQLLFWISGAIRAGVTC